jgi:hypothetical protein
VWQGKWVEVRIFNKKRKKLSDDDENKYKNQLRDDRVGCIPSLIL